MAWSDQEASVTTLFRSHFCYFPFISPFCNFSLISAKVSLAPNLLLLACIYSQKYLELCPFKGQKRTIWHIKGQIHIYKIQLAIKQEKRAVATRHCIPGNGISRFPFSGTIFPSRSRTGNFQKIETGKGKFYSRDPVSSSQNRELKTISSCYLSRLNEIVLPFHPRYIR